jgi:endonuclease/exonuclease/phosphatase family metal-dependent hydrolase
MSRCRSWVASALVRLAIASVVLLPAVTAVVPASASTAGPSGNGPHRLITVMTQNMDEATDFTPLFTAATPADFVAAASAIIQEVIASDIPARAQLMAAEITAAAPDVVMLQEATIWTWQPPAGPASADLLGDLESALAADGAHYAPAAVLNEASGAAPVPGFGTVSFQDRDAILVRTDEPPGHLRVSGVQSGHYATQLTLPTAVGPVTILRGWISADVTTQGRTVRVITTHPEDASSAVQQAQASELLSGPASTSLPVIIAGDLNTGPLAAGGFLTPTYQNILASGFTDAWTVTNPGVPGMTNAFHAEDPYGPSVPDKRIDLVLVNGGLRPVSVTLTGTSAVNGLWPSDHAGVIAAIQIPS